MKGRGAVVAMSRVARIACGALAVAALAGGPARAEEGALFKDMLGTMGIIQRDRDPILYRERAPLVVPPKLDLRPPAAAEAGPNPQWPNDPDVAAARRKASDARVPVTETESRRVQDRPTLSVEELRAGRRAGAAIPTAPTHKSDRVWISPEELRNTGRKTAAAARREPDVEPDRTDLTQPPTGYRRSANGQAIPRDFEPVGHKVDEANPREYLREQAARR